MPLFWDLETCYLSKDLAPDGQPISWSVERRHFMGVAWAVSWTPADGFLHWAHRLFKLDGIQVRYLYDLPEYLERADHCFDYSNTDIERITLEACITGEALRLQGHTDVLQEIVESLERYHGDRLKWPSLGEVGQATVGTGKCMYGSAAPDVFRRGYAGDLQALRKGALYCQKDVEILHLLSRFIAKYGYCVHPTGVVIPCHLEGGVPAWQQEGILPRKDLWRRDPITDAQISMIRRLSGMPRWAPVPGMTKGQASEWIEAAKNRQRKAVGG